VRLPRTLEIGTEKECIPLVFRDMGEYLHNQGQEHLYYGRHILLMKGSHTWVHNYHDNHEVHCTSFHNHSSGRVQHSGSNGTRPLPESLSVSMPSPSKDVTITQG
jgi:hypothetical protein